MKNLFKKLITYIITLEAKMILKKHKPFVIAVTGNMGKTSTKDVIYQILKNNLIDIEGDSLVAASKKSLNSDIGIPLTILSLESGYTNMLAWLKIIFASIFKVFEDKYCKYLILEVGADSPGDIKKVTEYIKPDIVVLTGFQKVPVHIENFDGDRSLVVREKKYLVDALRDGGTFIYNLDDQDSIEISESINEKRNIKLKTFSLKNHEADICLAESGIKRDEMGKLVGMCSKVSLGAEKWEVEISGTLGDAALLSVLPGVLIAAELNVDLKNVMSEVNNIKTPNGRMKILDGVYNSTLIDDSYNASPKAMQNGIDTVRGIDLRGGEKKILVLGDMLELGEYTREEHLAAGMLAAKSADYLVTSGIRGRMIAEGALDGGMKDENIFMCDTSIDAGREVLRLLDGLREERFKIGMTEKDLESVRDVIYIKGSQGARMEKAVKMLLASTHNPAEHLVRQDQFWKSK